MPTDSAAQRTRSKTLVRRLILEGINRGNPEILDAVLAPDYRGPQPFGTSLESIKELIRRSHRAFPDVEWTIEEQIAEGTTVMTRFTARGTHQGPLFGLPATGKWLSIQGILISRCRDNAIVAQSIQVDCLELLHQLGVMPSLSLDKTLVVARVVRAATAWSLEPSEVPE